MATEFSPPPVFSSLTQYLEVVKKNYEACLAHVDHSYQVNGADAKIRLHYVKFSSQGDPKFAALAKALVSHITYYCIAAKKRPGNLKAHEWNELFIEARDMFRMVEDSGEVGELLLYFLQEAVLEAPQILCKMELKTNPNDEVKGADGVHINWNHERGCLNLFIGESKLYQSYGSALKSAFSSIDDLHSSNKLQHEITLVTSHFKHLDDDFRDAVTTYLDDTDPDGEVNIVHACLVGYDWFEYKKLLSDDRNLFIETFSSLYVSHAARLKEKLDELFGDFGHKHLSYEFFFIPFIDVQAFRDDFYRVLTGNDD
jgi:hypothetical protein